VATALPSVGTPDPATGTVTGALNIADPDRDPLTYSVPSQPASGTVTVDAAGTYTYTPTKAARDAATQASMASFTVIANDGQGATTPASVTVPILPTPTVSQIPVIVAPIAVGAHPVAVAIHGNTAYVVNQFSNSVSVIDTTTNQVTGTIPVGASCASETDCWTYPGPINDLVVTHDSSKVYVVRGVTTIDNGYQTSGLYTIYTSDNAVSTPIWDPYLVDAAITPDGTRIYWAEGDYDSIIVDGAPGVSVSTPDGPWAGTGSGGQPGQQAGLRGVRQLRVGDRRRSEPCRHDVRNPDRNDPGSGGGGCRRQRGRQPSLCHAVGRQDGHGN
jgi:YVTN family beta-propeller protein/VCBS repeat-containing protein